MLLPKLLHYVSLASLRQGIDESHGLLHSFNVLQYASRIYRDEVLYCPDLRRHERVILAAATLHDMCDDKYAPVPTAEALRIREYLQGPCRFSAEETDLVHRIVTTCSYGYVQEHGYPDSMNSTELRAFHVVREADLLTSYDVERSLIYQTKRLGRKLLEETFQQTNMLFIGRVLRLRDDGLFTTAWAKKESERLHQEALERIWAWKMLLQDDNNKGARPPYDPCSLRSPVPTRFTRLHPCGGGAPCDPQTQNPSSHDPIYTQNCKDGKDNDSY